MTSPVGIQPRWGIPVYNRTNSEENTRVDYACHLKYTQSRHGMHNR
jgi:hypothetical protein